MLLMINVIKVINFGLNNQNFIIYYWIEGKHRYDKTYMMNNLDMALTFK
jgi:hypothetical protein